MKEFFIAVSGYAVDKPVQKLDTGLKHLFGTLVQIYFGIRLGDPDVPDNSRRNEDTKTRLIEAAGEVFAQYGFRASTVRQICKRARTNVGSVNYHFRDKKGLYAAIFEHSLQLAMKKYPPDLGTSREASPEEKLRAYIYSFLLRLMAEGLPAWHGKLIAQEMAEPSGALGVLMENAVRPLYQYLAGIVRELLHETKSPSGEESDETFLTTISIVGQCVHHQIARHVIEALRPRTFDPKGIERIADHISRFSLGGIREMGPAASLRQVKSPLPSRPGPPKASGDRFRKGGKILHAVIFDCDGILVDSEPLHYRAFQEVLVPLGLGHSFDVYLERFVGFDDRDAFIHVFKEAGRDLSPMSLEGLVEAKAAALREIIRAGVPGFPGVVELVSELMEKGIPMAVASGALRPEIEAFISSLGLNGAFRIIVAADEVKKSKPDPETYLLAMERLSQVYGSKPLDPGNCLAIEDTLAGIRSAKSAGLKVVAVTNSFSAAELAEADKVVGSLSELSYSEIVKLLERRRPEQQ